MRMTLSEALKLNKEATLSTEELVRRCVQAEPEAWNELIDRYKNLIYSIPLKYGLSRDEASDIFQTVCLSIISKLPTLREPQALTKWIMQIASHECSHWVDKRRRFVNPENAETFEAQIDSSSDSNQMLRQVEEEQMIREVIHGLSPRCQQLVNMLFFEEPSRPYKDIASNLGVAVGSIGFLRQRCIDRIRKKLDDLGFL